MNEMNTEHWQLCINVKSVQERESGEDVDRVFEKVDG